MWLLLPLLLQVPPPAPPVAPTPDPRALFTDWAQRLERAPVVHLEAEGFLLTPHPERKDENVRWSFSSEVWMAKGGRVNARTRWTGPKPEVGDPETFTSLCFADGKHSWQGFEGPEPLRQMPLSSPRFVPYPLPEVFGMFDKVPGKDLPVPSLGERFDWGLPVRDWPTVVVLDPDEPKEEPASWYGFAERELAGWCTLMPERLGGDVLRGKLKRWEWLERLPEVDPPRFEPPAK